MDSLSQIALGAALGEAVLGRHIGRRAAVAGAILGTLPDLDVLVPYADAIDSFTRHRSWSHSLFVLSAASPPLAWLLHRFLQRTRATGMSVSGSTALSPPGFGRCWLAVWLILITHPLLDGFTVYGTQIFWPLPVRPVAIGSIFIIDPLYTLPLLAGVLWLWFRRSTRAHHANRIGLAVSTAYLGLTLLIQAHITGVAQASLLATGRDPSRLHAVPLPMSLLWRVVVLGDGEYHEGWRSLLDDAPDMTFATHPLCTALPATVAAHPPVQRLDWFTNGFVRARERDGTLVLTDLRMGAESNYVFSFAVAEQRDREEWQAVLTRDLPPDIDMQSVRQVLRRVTDEDAIRVSDKPDPCAGGWVGEQGRLG